MSDALRSLFARPMTIALFSALTLGPDAVQASALEPVNRVTALALSQPVEGRDDAPGLPFDRDPAREREALDIALDDILDAMGQDAITDPAHRSAMIEGIDQAFPLQRIVGDLGQDVGLSLDDLADVIAIRLGLLWVLATDFTVDPGQADLDTRDLRDRIAQAAAENTVALPDDDAGRQLLADLTLYAIVTDIQTAQNLEGTARTRALADRFETKAGMAPDGIDLTDLDAAPADAPRTQLPVSDAAEDAAFDSVWVRYGHSGAGLTFHPRMMFEDGTVTRDLGAPPEAFDVTESRNANPDDWGTWRRNDDTMLKRFPEDTRDYEFSIPGQMFEALPAAGNLQLEGRYMAMSTLSVPQMGGTHVTASWDAFDFSQDGSFANAGGMSASAPGLSAHALPEGERGRYRIDGHVITFEFDDGRAEQRLFFLFPRSDAQVDPDVIGIGGAIYTRR